MNVKIKFRYLPYVINLSLSLICLGLLEFVSASFNINNIMTSSYMFNVVIPSIINLVIQLNSIFMFKTFLLNNNSFISDKTKLINDICNNASDSDFDKFLFLKDKQKKIDAYKKGIRKQITKLEKKAKIDDLIIYNDNNEEAKEKNKYCNKRKQLEKMVNDDEFLRKNIYYMNVKYTPIKKSEVKNNYKSTKEDNEYEDVNRTAILDTLPSWLFMFTLTAFFYSFTLMPKTFLLMTVISYLIRILTASFSFFGSRNYMNDKGLKMILNNLDITLDIYREYTHWKIANLNENSDVVERKSVELLREKLKIS